jgi:hypothetical protein
VCIVADQHTADHSFRDADTVPARRIADHDDSILQAWHRTEFQRRHAIPESVSSDMKQRQVGFMRNHVHGGFELRRISVLPHSQTRRVRDAVRVAQDASSTDDKS